MKSIVINCFGTPSEAFENIEQEIPVPDAQQLLIRVMATSYNPVDSHLRMGHMGELINSFPAVLHGDFAGIVHQVGKNVPGFKEGDKVYGWAGGFGGRDGALSEFMRVDHRLVAKMPETLSFDEAAAVPLVALTAYDALFERAKLQAGQKVLIYGGMGGVGHMAIQMAKLAGAEVYAVVSSDKHEETLRGFGADHVINYKTLSVDEYIQQYSDGAGFDMVFDTVGGANLVNSFKAVKVLGTLITTIAMSREDLSPLHLKGINFHVVFLVIPIAYHLEPQMQEFGDNLTQINQWIEEGKLRVLVDPHQFTIDQVADAHLFAESGRNVGKVVLSRNN